MLLVVLLSTAYSLTCYKYECADLDGSTCISYANNTYYLDPCSSSNEYCSPSSPGTSDSVSCTKITPSTQPSSYPGEPCSQSTDCVYGACVAKECYTASLACTSDAECNPGNYCNNTNSCSAQVALNSTGCTSEASCVNNAFCDYNSTQSKCLAYYSLPAYTPVAYCPNGVNSACESGYCALDAEASQYLCTPTLTNFWRLPAACSESDNCRSVNLPANFSSSDSISTECVCGYNPLANAYCGLFNGDAPALSYFTQLKAWLKTSSIKECNTARRFSQACYEAFWDQSNADKLTLYGTYFQMYPQLIDNSNCVKAIYTSAYWILENQDSDDDDDDDVALWLLPTYGLMLVVG